MKCYSRIQKSIAFIGSCLLIFVLTSQHADAARRSRVLSIGLFASGMSLQLGATFLKSSAQERYDAYLNAAIQADIQTHKDAFLVRRNAGKIMSGVGLGCVGLAVLFSIYNQLDTPSESSELAEEDAFSGYRSQTLRTNLRAQRIDFTNYGFGNTSLSSRRSAFQLLPHYDFQNQRASLRLLHYF
ncbi:hypothetical protein F4141_07225 [Candidatus Poribacteria bacterium]|nr:hypothetical protein [Candidatus Poribacteria bacterium]